MKRCFVIQDVHTGLYFRCVDGTNHTPDAADDAADVYSMGEALMIAAAYYRCAVEPENKLCHITEAKVSTYFRWLSRRAGKVTTPAKRLANARRARLPRKRKDHETPIAA